MPAVLPLLALIVGVVLGVLLFVKVIAGIGWLLIAIVLVILGLFLYGRNYDWRR